MRRQTGSCMFTHRPVPCLTMGMRLVDPRGPWRSTATPISKAAKDVWRIKEGRAPPPLGYPTRPTVLVLRPRGENSVVKIFSFSLPFLLVLPLYEPCCRLTNDNRVCWTWFAEPLLLQPHIARPERRDKPELPHAGSSCAQRVRLDATWSEGA